MTHAITGPIASRRSDLHGAETQTLNATYATVKATAITKRTVGRPPPDGRGRRVSPPSRTCSGAIPCAIAEESQQPGPDTSAHDLEGGCRPNVTHSERLVRPQRDHCEPVSPSA